VSEQSEWEVRARAELETLRQDLDDGRQHREARARGGQQVGPPSSPLAMIPPSAAGRLDRMLARLGIRGEP